MAVSLLQQFAEKPERHRRLRGGAGLGDDIHGKILSGEQLLHFRKLVIVQTVAHEVNVGGILLFQVIIGGAEALNDAPGP